MPPIYWEHLDWFRCLFLLNRQTVKATTYQIYKKNVRKTKIICKKTKKSSIFAKGYDNFNIHRKYQGQNPLRR